MSNDIFYFMVSKYSSACEQVFGAVKELATHFNIQPVFIDDPETRRLVVKTVKTVPSMLIISGSTVQLFEGKEFAKLLGDLQNIVRNIAAQQQAQMESQMPQMQTQLEPQMQVQSIAQPQQPPEVGKVTKLDTNASVNARLQPQQFTSPPPPQPMLTTQIAAGNSQPQTTQLSPMPTGEAQPIGDTSQMFDTNNSYSHEDIMGTAVPATGKGGAKLKSDAMQREREMMDQQFRGPHQQ